MESLGKKPRRRRSFTPEFRAEIVELCQRGDRSVGQVAKDFDLTETAVREWVKQAGRDTGTRADGGLISTERQELAQLRRENRRLREDVGILKRPRLSSRQCQDHDLPGGVRSFFAAPVCALVACPNVRPRRVLACGDVA
jgi:transposase